MKVGRTQIISISTNLMGFFDKLLNLQPLKNNPSNNEYFTIYKTFYKNGLYSPLNEGIIPLTSL